MILGIFHTFSGNRDKCLFLKKVILDGFWTKSMDYIYTIHSPPYIKGRMRIMFFVVGEPKILGRLYELLTSEFAQSPGFKG